MKHTRPLGIAATLLLATLALTGCAQASTPESSPESTESATPGTTETPAASGTCVYTPSGSAAKTATTPPAEPTVSGLVTATINTSAGELTAELDADRAPCTVGSFVSLAEQDYFSDSPCHRLTTQGIFVLQCGDPSGTGSGGPGYRYADELSQTASSDYAAGAIAMANAGADTNGSQFFLVYDDSTQLTPSYTVFGELSPESLALVQQIAAAGTESGGGDGAPATPVTIESVTIS